MVSLSAVFQVVRIPGVGVGVGTPVHRKPCAVLKNCGPPRVPLSALKRANCVRRTQLWLTALRPRLNGRALASPISGSRIEGHRRGAQGGALTAAATALRIRWSDRDRRWDFSRLKSRRANLERVAPRCRRANQLAERAIDGGRTRHRSARRAGKGHLDALQGATVSRRVFFHNRQFQGLRRTLARGAAAGRQLCCEDEECGKPRARRIGVIHPSQ